MKKKKQQKNFIEMKRRWRRDETKIKLKRVRCLRLFFEMQYTHIRRLS